MRRRLISALIALTLASALAPTVAHAQHRGFKGHSVRMGNVKVQGSVGAHPFAHSSPVRRPPFHGRGFRPFVPFGVGFPVALYPTPDYDIPAYYAPSAGAIPVAQPAPDVIQYPGGRYELRGDGITRAYVWVWVPDPPSAPPATAADPGVGTRSPASSGNLPEAKIITIPASDASLQPSTDPTGPKIITMPRPNTGPSTKR